MKKMLCALLAMVLALSMALPALAETAGALNFQLTTIVAQQLTGRDDYDVYSDDADYSDFGEMVLACFITEPTDEEYCTILVVGPNPDGNFAHRGWIMDWSWEQSLQFFIDMLESWDMMTINLPEELPLHVIFYTEAVEGGSIEVMDKESAELVIKLFAPILDGTDNTANTTTPSVPDTLVVPSVLSFADYRVSERYGNWDNGSPYIAYEGFASDDLMVTFAKDYINLLTSKYDYELVKYDDVSNLGTFLVYYLDYTGPENTRPFAHRSFSGDVVIELFYGFGGTMYVSVSPTLNYVETDDRTTVNYQNR